MDKLELSIAMGCTISPILIVLAMEVIFRAVERGASAANLGGECSMLPLKAIMDDTVILCSKENENHSMLVVQLDPLMDWSKMSFKLMKSRSVFIRKDTKHGIEALEQVSVGLQAEDKCGLPGKYVVRCLRFMIIPKHVWPLLVHEISTSAVESIKGQNKQVHKNMARDPSGQIDVAMYC
ncbi:reverse transcriptase [Plakobranchus ocellatus]|uniref:Reverse transcriptase n=1 Tax=Plakobranchus ocellatus TaxID=259542 RepID=A0AAV3Z812_9GAST|nr:reverse transcriptase [Plakobranchus ocellatus]